MILPIPKKFQSHWRALLLAFCVLVFAPRFGFSQEFKCIPSAALLKSLGERFGERQLATGIAGEAHMRLYVNPSNGSWTMAIFPNPTTACIAAGGDSFEIDEGEPVAQGKPL